MLKRRNSRRGGSCVFAVRVRRHGRLPLPSRRGNHNTVAGKNDFVQVFNGFYALDFGNQTGAYGCTAFHFFFDFGACDVQIFGRFHKLMAK